MKNHRIYRGSSNVCFQCIRLCVCVSFLKRKKPGNWRESGKKNVFTKRTYKFIGTFLMSWNPFEFTDRNTLCSAIVGCIDKLLLTSVCASFECSATQRCACALCLCSAPPTNEKKGERDKKERRKKYRTKGTQNAEEKKKFDEKRNTMVCECVLVCSWLHTNNDDLKKNICSLSQVITFFFLPSLSHFDSVFSSSNNKRKFRLPEP